MIYKMTTYSRHVYREKQTPNACSNGLMFVIHERNLKVFRHGKFLITFHVTTLNVTQIKFVMRRFTVDIFIM